MATYPIESMTAHGVRGLRHLRLDGMRRLNVIVGENNSGKTSVLEALAIVSNPNDPTEWVAVARRRDFGGLDESMALSLQWCIARSSTVTEPARLFGGMCELACVGLFVVDRLRVVMHEFSWQAPPDAIEAGNASTGDGYDRRSGMEITHTLVGQGGPPPVAIRVRDDGSWRVFNSNGSPRVKTQTLTPYSYQLNQMQVSRLSDGVVQRHRDATLDLIQNFDADVQDITILSVSGRRPSIYLTHRRLGVAPLSIFGDALRRAVLLATTLPTLARGGLLLLDEIETGIHVSALKRVFGWLGRSAKALDVQVVATTHSLEAVDALLSGVDAPDELATFHLDQTPEQTRVRRFDGDLLARLRRERGLDVR